MAGLLNIPKFVDYRKKVKRHPSRKFPVLSLKGKTTIAIHHSLTRQGLGGSNAESYARYHVDSLGWPSIGYSYVIEPDGTIKFCNDIELRTYHVGDHNNYAVGICLTGDFRYEQPTAAQKESLRNLVNALQKTYPHLKYIKGHNEFPGYASKQCPVFDYKAVLANKTTAAPTPKPASKPNIKSIAQMADEVIQGKHGSGHENRRKSLGISQAEYEKVRAEVNRRAGASTQSKPKGKSIAQMAKEVIDGKHGNGHEARRKSLGISQAEYEKVRSEVNRLAGGGSSKPKKSIAQMATEVIQGKHGSGHENRRKSLGISQAEYEKVRAEVNRRM